MLLTARREQVPMSRCTGCPAFRDSAKRNIRWNRTTAIYNRDASKHLSVRKKGIFINGNITRCCIFG